MFRTLEYSSLEFVSNFVLQNSNFFAHAPHAVVCPRCPAINLWDMVSIAIGRLPHNINNKTGGFICHTEEDVWSDYCIGFISFRNISRPESSRAGRSNSSGLPLKRRSTVISRKKHRARSAGTKCEEGSFGL